MPDFVRELREKVGTAPLWLSSVTAVVLRPDERGEQEILLVRRSDNGQWTPVTGIIDPGEQPAVAAVREVAEEAAVRATPERLVAVTVTDMVVYDNGDRTQYLDLIFRMRWEDGDPAPADGENTDARWFPLGALPPLTVDMQGRIQAALDNEPHARFRTSA